MKLFFDRRRFFGAVDVSQTWGNFRKVDTGRETLIFEKIPFLAGRSLLAQMDSGGPKI